MTDTPHPREWVSATRLPDDAFRVIAQLTVVSYLKEDGTTGYTVHTAGDMPMTTYLGLTVIAQDHIKEWGRS